MIKKCLPVKNKRVLTLLLFLFVCSALSALSYTVSGYKFEIHGNTKEETIRSLIVPTYVETFETEQELKDALEEKRQVLINTRIFFEDEIFYHFDVDPSGGGNNKVYVTFATYDAKNKLILPYPKYDSNTGLMLGLRYKDKNFMGLYKDFSVNIDTKQYESSYEEGDFYVEVPFECFKVGNIEFSGQFEAELDLHDSSNDYVSFNLHEKGLRFGNIGVNAGGIVEFNYNKGDFRKLGYDFSLNRILLGNKGAYLDTYSGMLLDWKTRSDSFLDGKLTVGNVSVGNTRWSNISYIKFKLKNENDMSDGLKRYQLEDSVRLNFAGDMEKWSAGTKAIHYKDYDEKGDFFKTLSDVTYRLTPVYSVSALFDTKRHTEGGLTDLIPGERLTVNSKAFGKVPFVFSISEHNDFKLNEDSLEAYFGSSLSTEFDEINYRGNFRVGHQFKISAEAEYYPWKKNGEKKSEYKFNIDFTSFPFALSWFNPSVRFKLLASTKKTYWEDDSSWRLDKDDIQQLFRGIRTDNEYVKRAYDSSVLVSALNVNLLTNMFVFEDFGRTYLNLFVDTGILRGANINPADNKDYKVLTGAGMEVIAIMDSHPAYPIRASLGFNTEKLYDKFVADKDDTELEYEVYIGLGFMY